MIKKVLKLGARTIKNPSRATKLALKQPVLLVTAGPSEYGQYVKRALSKHVMSHSFPNGITTTLDPSRAQNWYLFKKRPVVAVLYGSSTDVDIEQLGNWIVSIKKYHTSFFMSPELRSKIDHAIADNHVGIKTLDYLENPQKILFAQLQQDMIRSYFSNDFLLLDIASQLPTGKELISMQHAAYTYGPEVGIVAPSLIEESRAQLVSGPNYNRQNQAFEKNASKDKDYGQLAIPRYSLSGYSHGLYITAKTIQRVQTTARELLGLPFHDQVSIFIGKAWQHNFRTLTVPAIQLKTHALPSLATTMFHSKWLENRNIKNENGQVRVIYVLNATSISGGIRTVFEHINGLKKRGMAVELWSLQGQPNWTDLDVSVKKFSSYFDLEIALRAEEAIKIATWWETAQPVWLASVNNGLPVFMIQEFETWFYPEDKIAQAAVVSCYRPEFHAITIAQYTKDELALVGVDATLIPAGYEPEYYHVLPEVKRSPDVVLAVGRSFFQKNFQMTLDAWRQLGSSGPKLSLFGAEPNIVQGERISYSERPSNADVNKLYNQATLFVQTSRHEGFCLPIIEAMAAGCPVICTDSHGNRDFSIHEKTCLIVEHDDIEGLAAAIERLLGDKKLQETLRKNGLAMAKQYQWKGILDKFEAFYKNLDTSS